ncbi:MAG: VRR-NUC domain-containing protein [Paludibacteraceae bacterium]|nr:VRR-NUC domain-containing protein [Paludibacteraceae bacterium]
MNDAEHRLQVSFVRYFRYQYPKAVIYAIPNGGARNVIVASKLKAEGVLSGVPDLHVPVARGGYHSLYIELKNGKKGRLSENQKAMIATLEGLGHKCIVGRTFDELKEEVDKYMAE